MNRRGRIARAIIYNSLVIAGGAFLGLRFAHLPSTSFWSALFLASGGLLTVVLLFTTQVFSRFDKLLDEAKTLGPTRYLQFSGYLRARRARLILWLLAGAFAAAIDVFASNYVTKGEVASAAWLSSVAVGCMAVMAIVLYALRVASIYFSLDKFREDIYRADENEKARLEMMRTLRPPSVITEFRGAEGTPLSTAGR